MGGPKAVIRQCSGYEDSRGSLLLEHTIHKAFGARGPEESDFQESPSGSPLTHG